MGSMKKSELAAIKNDLLARDTELKARLGRVETALSSSHSQDFAEQATEREQDEALEGQEIVFEQELVQIEAAITRIDDGSYGICASCGEDIAPKRLEVQPEAPLCMRCATRD